ncbi:proteoglycan 4-like isoform X2 [Homalodisca vitripennis]|nr:proteoglycan 4-like isoform X2 [Homalodisca vitripennis]
MPLDLEQITLPDIEYPYIRVHRDILTRARRSSVRHARPTIQRPPRPASPAPQQLITCDPLHSSSQEPVQFAPPANELSVASVAEQPSAFKQVRPKSQLPIRPVPARPTGPAIAEPRMNIANVPHTPLAPPIPAEEQLLMPLDLRQITLPDIEYPYIQVHRDILTRGRRSSVRHARPTIQRPPRPASPAPQQLITCYPLHSSSQEPIQFAPPANELSIASVAEQLSAAEQPSAFKQVRPKSHLPIRPVPVRPTGPAIAEPRRNIANVPHTPLVSEKMIKPDSIWTPPHTSDSQFPKSQQITLYTVEQPVANEEEQLMYEYEGRNESDNEGHNELEYEGHNQLEYETPPIPAEEQLPMPLDLGQITLPDIEYPTAAVGEELMHDHAQQTLTERQWPIQQGLGQITPTAEEQQFMYEYALHNAFRHEQQTTHEPQWRTSQELEPIGLVPHAFVPWQLPCMYCGMRYSDPIHRVDHDGREFPPFYISLMK